MQLDDELAPKVGVKVKCMHPFDESKRAWVTPSKVEILHTCKWENGTSLSEPEPLSVIRSKVQESLKTLREDHKRSLNPTPYKVAVSERLYEVLHDLWRQNEPIGQMS